MLFGWGLAQLCHNETYSSCMRQRPNEAGVNIILCYLLTVYLYFNCVPNLDLRWGGVQRGGLPIHNAGEMLEKGRGGIISGPAASCHGGPNLVPRGGSVIGAG